MIRPTCLLLCTTLSACSYLSRAPSEPTLADLSATELPRSVPLPDTPSLAELAGMYRDVLEVADAQHTRTEVLERLAVTEMEVAEQELVTGNNADPALFSAAIQSYRELIDANPGRPGEDILLYQLARAYELGADQQQSLDTLRQLLREHPESPHAAEARFRLAEFSFSNSDYTAAATGY